MAIKCPKCDSKSIYIKKDGRGIPEARCLSCDTYIKKMGAGETMDFYESITLDLKETMASKGEIPAVVAETDNRMPCKYCTEYYYTRRGRLGTVYIPIETKYCPVCGRKILEEDRKY